MHLRDRVLHGACGEELALFDVDHLVRFGCGDQQVRLPAEESGDLKHVHVGGGHGGLLGGVDVSGHGHAEALAHGGEDAQRFFVTDARKAVDARPVGLAVASFEDEGQVQLAAGLHEGLGNAEGHVLAFDGARARDDLEAVACGPSGGLKVAFHGAKVVKVAQGQKARCQCRPRPIRPPVPARASQRVRTARVPPGRP